MHAPDEVRVLFLDWYRPRASVCMLLIAHGCECCCCCCWCGGGLPSVTSVINYTVLVARGSMIILTVTDSRIKTGHTSIHRPTTRTQHNTQRSICFDSFCGCQVSVSQSGALTSRCYCCILSIFGHPSPLPTTPSRSSL
ncbi:hypothetical protein IE81DRAFT_175598 [Ceraceosorus guamensis]|uniref:Uncharacterized protein n=1 Tax=Ceraceosorus guamensis TaxID=1522189 RepID=A0A316VVD2_9BASI|nr:hypothetical protein IE81DRAFT_175598 [Ceraceosorus guamensis]PWN41402.1 hypothetical protein IE81DRAFT_175598 [Ceraceosorus guamensis]